jgi:3-hydroxyisobutyrate dehydrogenase-like beta-hydroxyacid dehydrogenase
VAVTASPPADVVERVGIAGWGRMGAVMGAHLIAAGIPVTAFDTDPDAAASIEKAGAVPAGDLLELAGASDLVLVVVATDDQVRDVINGPEGLVRGSAPGTVIGICATVRPSTSVEVADQADAHGVVVVDMALVGGERGAAAASLRVMCGGPEEAIDACRDVLSVVASDVCRIGAVGTGQVAKTANNILLWACIRVDLEVLRLSKALGLEPNALRSHMAIGSGANRPLEEWGQHTPRWPEKDLEIALELAQGAGIEVPFIEALAPLMSEVTKETLHEMR